MTAVGWHLREILSARKITNVALSKASGLSVSSIGRLKAVDILPAIGGAEVERIANAINELSQEKYGRCTSAALMGLNK